MPGWSTPRRIVMATQNPNGTGAQEMRATLAGAAPGVEIVFVADAEEMLAKEAASADAIIGGDDMVCDDRVLAAAKQVRWVAVMSAGVEACLGKPALEKPGITVTNMRAVAGPVMAEHTIALMFALSRSLQVSVGRQATRRGLEPQFRRLAATGADRQDGAGRGPRRHRPRSREARARAGHEGDRARATARAKAPTT